MKKLFAVLTLGLLTLLSPSARASTPNVQGRWEFVTLTGDTPTQMNQSGQSTLSTYLLQNGSTITNLPALTSDAYMDDVYCYNNDVITGTANSNGTVTLKLVITNPDNSKVTMNFTGTVGAYTQHGAEATTITGTYTSNGKYTTGGNFVATFFPDFTGVTYSGTLDGPDTGTGPTQVPASFTIQTKADHTLSITNVNIGAPLNACFTPPFHVINDPNFPLAPTSAAGILMDIYLQDSVGGQIWFNSFSTLQATDALGNPISAALDELYGDGQPYPSTGQGYVGTNTQYEVYYGITTNNSCNGLGGGDAPFVAQPTRHGRHQGDEPRKHRGHRR